MMTMMMTLGMTGDSGNARMEHFGRGKLARATAERREVWLYRIILIPHKLNEETT